MRSTINGEGFSASATSDRTLDLRLLRYLQQHSPEERGSQVLIYVDQGELFPETPDGHNPEETVAEMKRLAETVNSMFVEQTKDYVPFDSENNVALPDPADIRLEVVIERIWNGEAFVTSGPAFQILTKKWVGPLSFDDGYTIGTPSYVAA